MSRYRSRRDFADKKDDLLNFIGGVSVLAIFYFAVIFFANRERFWNEVIFYLLPVVFFVIFCIFSYKKYQVSKLKKEEEVLRLLEQEHDQKLHSVIRSVREGGMDAAVNGFIDRFGRENGEEIWEYRGYQFELRRLRDFRESLIQKGINISTENSEELLFLLQHHIDIKEKDFLNNGISATYQHKFAELNKEGSDFEHLLVRLYDAMGYTSKRIGGSGDQGGDVVASKDGENILIQAKCYANPVGNEAVQQVFSALAYHGCNKAAVITTSTFTPGAVALAKANAVELIDRELLKRLLLEQLDEVWL